MSDAEDHDSDAEDRDDEELAAPAEEAPPGPLVPPREALSAAFAVTIASGAVLTFAFDPRRAAQPTVIGSIGALYALLALIAGVRLHRRGELVARLRPHRGDITLAALTAGLLYGAGRILLPVLGGHGSPREAWILRVYLQVGDEVATGRLLVGATVFAVAALEEMAWRGLCLRTLEDAFGARRALSYTTLLYGLAHVPTAFLLRDPGAGLNPLLVLAALGCGLAWGAMALRTGRLLPSLLAHALFSWSVVEFPLWSPALRM